MRLCLVYDCLFPHTVGGAERWYRNLAERLSADGHQVTYLTLRQWERGRDAGLPGVDVRAVGPRMALYVRGRRRILPPLVFGAGVLIHLALHGRRYDAVHTASFPYFSVLAAALARPLGRFSLVVDWHEVWSREYWRGYLGRAGAIGWWVQALCARVPQRAFCFSRLHARRLRQIGLRGEPRVLTGEYAGSLEPPTPRPAEPVAVFAGRHIPEKQLPALVPAVALARERIPGLRLEVYGDGPERAAVERLIAELRLGDAIQVKGFVSAEQVERALERALCMVLPSRREGYGMIVVEAAARAVPSVVVRAPDNAALELVEDGVNGVVAPSASTEDLATAIVRVHEAGEPLRASTAACSNATRAGCRSARRSTRSRPPTRASLRLRLGSELALLRIEVPLPGGAAACGGVSPGRKAGIPTASLAAHGAPPPHDRHHEAGPLRRRPRAARARRAAAAGRVTEPPGEVDLAVVGAGIIGLAVARELAARHPGSSLAALEREPQVGRHQTGNNSGVIHAGIYYSPGSLKARLCVEGARELYDFCEARGVPHERCGKVIVARDERELPGLDELERRGRANGVPGLRRLTTAQLGELEPHCRGVGALHSPATGIADFGAVAAALAADVRERGGSISTACGVEGVGQAHGRVALRHARGETRARFAVFCAGAWSDRLAVAAGASADPRIVPFRGAYLKLRPERRHLVRSLIYPVPDPGLPFLGVHLSRHIDGEVSLGPTALVAGARDAYELRRMSARDLRDTLAWPGTWRMARRWWRTALAELHQAISRRAFARAAAAYVPELRADDFAPYFAGVRAQALGRDGRLVDDFVVSETERALHVRNAPSPAATSSLAIARLIADRVDRALE